MIQRFVPSATAFLIALIVLLPMMEDKLAHSRAPEDLAPANLDPALLTRFAEACPSDNPFFITSCYSIGAAVGDAAVVAFRDTPDETDHHVLARSEQVGATYGLAHHPGSHYVFIAAYQKRGTAYGPGGPGAVYRLDMRDDSVETFIDVPNVGTDLHDPTNNYWPDMPAIPTIGKTSLGDIDLDASGETLYVVNLFDRRIHRYSTRDGSPLGTISIGAAGLPWEDDARPFGLKVWQGRLFHAVVNAAEATQANADLRGHIYASDLDGGGMREVSSFELVYPRDAPEPPFEPWHDVFSAQGGRDPMPMISDIEFADNGDMIIGIRDRLGDMTFMDDNSNGNPPGEFPGRPGGDILLAQRQLGPGGGADDDLWAAIIPQPETFIDNTGGHGETSFGGLGRVGALDRVVMTGLSPLRIYTGGAYWFDNSGGAPVAREELYALTDRDNFGKANGLGDVEILCPAGEVTPTPSLTPTPPPTPTPWIRSIYIPLIDNEPCRPESIFTDVVLVLDMSTSMYRSTRTGRSKHEAAMDAAHTFTEIMQLEPAAWDRGPGSCPAQRPHRSGRLQRSGLDRHRSIAGSPGHSRRHRWAGGGHPGGNEARPGALAGSGDHRCRAARTLARSRADPADRWPAQPRALPSGQPAGGDSVGGCGSGEKFRYPAIHDWTGRKQRRARCAPARSGEPAVRLLFRAGWRGSGGYLPGDCGEVDGLSVNGLSVCVRY